MMVTVLLAVSTTKLMLYASRTRLFKLTVFDPPPSVMVTVLAIESNVKAELSRLKRFTVCVPPPSLMVSSLVTGSYLNSIL